MCTTWSSSPSCPRRGPGRRGRGGLSRRPPPPAPPPPPRGPGEATRSHEGEDHEAHHDHRTRHEGLERPRVQPLPRCSAQGELAVRHEREGHDEGYEENQV